MRIPADRPGSNLLLSCALVAALGLWPLCVGAAGEKAVPGMEPSSRDLLTVVTLPPEESARNHIIYFPKLLALALSKTEATDGPFEILPYPRLLTGARFLAKLEKGDGLDVVWTMTNPDLEKSLLRIPVSLLRGLNSHRALLIRAEDQSKFDEVRSLEDLKKFRGAMVSHWPDTAILEHNGLPVETSAHYELMFSMLEAKRVDYFPRGLYEVWQEQQMHAEDGLAVEQSLMLYYHGPIYFFVNRSNKALADRIERGLRIAMDDGSFDELFFSIPGFKRGYDEIAKGKRRIFELPLP